MTMDCTNPYDNPVTPVDPFGDCGDPCGGAIIGHDAGLLYSTGRNLNHTLLREGISNQLSFGLIDDEFSFLDVSLGNANGCFVKADGMLCGIGTMFTNEATLTDLLADCIKCSCSATSSAYAIKTDGSLWSFGVNFSGELGLGDTDARTEFVQADAGPFVSVSAGYCCCFAIKADGSLWATGFNANGNLGFGDTTQRTSFEQVSVGPWASISQSGASPFALAITEAGALYGCGNGVYGRLCVADGDQTNYNVFTARGDGNVWADAKVGQSYSIALKIDGTIWTVGAGTSGALGQGDYNTNTALTQVGVALWEQIGAGNTFSMAVKSDGTVWATGANVYGQLGVNTGTTKYNVLTACVGLPGVVSLTTVIACGSFHAFALDGAAVYAAVDPYPTTADCPAFDENNPYDNDCA